MTVTCWAPFETTDETAAARSGLPSSRNAASTTGKSPARARSAAALRTASLADSMRDPCAKTMMALGIFIRILPLQIDAHRLPRASLDRLRLRCPLPQSVIAPLNVLLPVQNHRPVDPGC